MKLSLSAVFILSLLGCSSTPSYLGPKSAHFNGETFHNTIRDDQGLLDIIRYSLSFAFNKTPWPKWVAQEEAADEVLAKVEDALAITVINHSTVLIQVAGVNILTDPIFAERASPFTWAGPKRVTRPGIALENLPPIDVILISHNHYDHLDANAMLAMSTREAVNGPPLILVGLGNGELLTKNGLSNYREMDWNTTIDYKNLQFEFSEARHRSGRGLRDQMQTLWGAFVITSPQGKIYFAGDTGYGPHFRETMAKHGNFQVTLLPIGAYEPRSFMAPVHLNPTEAVQAHQDLGSSLSIAIHHSTFQLTYEGIDVPQKALEAALSATGLRSTDFQVPAFGKRLLIK